MELYYNNKNKRSQDGNGKDDDDKNSYVYSVPFDAGNRNDTLVTASNAIFHTEGGKETPVAVVGFQFHHSAMYTLFKNITSQCRPNSDHSCEKTCFTGDYQCYVIDNNGFVVISEQLQETGAFFGEVKPAFMQRMLDDGIFKNVTIYDYQAVCFVGKNIINMGNIIQTVRVVCSRVISGVDSNTDFSSSSL